VRCAHDTPPCRDGTCDEDGAPGVIARAILSNVSRLQSGQWLLVSSSITLWSLRGAGAGRFCVAIPALPGVFALCRGAGWG